MIVDQWNCCWMNHKILYATLFISVIVNLFLCFREQLVKLQHVIMEAKDNAVTKANESLTSAEEKVHKLSEQIQEMSSEVQKCILRL